MATAQDMWNEIDRRIGLALDEALALLGVENIPQGGAGGPGSAGGLPVHGNAHHMPPMALASDLTALEFIDLADTPNSYAGQALRYPRVTAGETALEFHAITAADVGADPAGTAAGLIADLLLEPDPFPQYLTEAEADLLYADIVHTHSAADIVSGTLASARGGTGVSNAGTLTVPSNVSITGGGTIALGGFTLTVPATGTVPLGTGAANQVTLWSGANTLIGDAGLTYDAAADTFALSGTATITATGADTYPFYVISDQPDVGTDGSAFGVVVYSTLSAGRFFFARAQGTLAVPTAVASGNRLFTVDARGWDGGTPGAFATAAQFQFEADGAVTSTPSAVPGRIKFLTADSVGTLIEAGRFTSNQALWINITSGGLATAGAVDADGEIRSNRTAGGLVTLYRRDTTVTSGESIGILAWDNNDGTLSGQRYAEIEVQASRAISTDAATGKMFLRTTGIGVGTIPVERLALGGYRDSLTDAANNSLFDVTLNAGEMAGGTVVWTIIASDGTDHQSYSGIVTYSTVNKAGAFTSQITHNVGNDSKAVSAGTLTATWNILAGANKVTIRVNPASSLTETTYRILYSILSNSPQSIVLL